MPADVLAGVLAAASVASLILAVRVERHRAVLAAVRVPPTPEADGSTTRSRPSGWMTPLAVVLGALVGWRLARGGGAIVGAAVGALVPTGVRRRRATKRKEAIQAQLADAISAVSAGIRAGLSIPQGLALAAEQTPDPLGGSLRTVVDRTSLGAPLEDALDHWVMAIPVPDVRLAAAVLRLHGRTGGALPAVLDGLARTLRERLAAIREVRSLTAQARLSGAILGLLPVAFFAFLWLTSRNDMAAAVSSPLGRTAIGLGLALQAVAFLWIRRLLRVEG